MHKKRSTDVSECKMSCNADTLSMKDLNTMIERNNNENPKESMLWGEHCIRGEYGSLVEHPIESNKEVELKSIVLLSKAIKFAIKPSRSIHSIDSITLLSTLLILVNIIRTS